MVARLLEMSATRMITELRGRMQRADAETDPEIHAAIFAELMAVEAYRRDLREQVHGV
jgi:DNA primase